MYLPYVALPERCPRGVVVEGWLVEAGDPVAEALWPLQLPGASARLLHNALAAVTFLAVSAPSMGEGRPSAEGLLPSRNAQIICRVGALFGLDAEGLLWLGQLVDRAEPATLDDLVGSLKREVDPVAWPKVLAVVRALAPPREHGAAAEHRWLDRLEARLGATTGAGAPESLWPHYRSLGLEPGVSWAAVREAYRRRAWELHPDRSGAGPEAMVRVNAAYAALRDAVRPVTDPEP